ncbi:UNVERIFIED_CONTAM: hypothetical protein Q9R58_15555 [Methylobacteriaceae bacterium AG10]|nr:hypothetical protein [Methylobacteriaceae bacterium AG10]
MPDPNPTVGELFKAKAVTDDQVNAAVEAYLAEPRPGVCPLGDTYVLDVDAAVRAHVPSRLVICDVHARKADKGTAVRTAILLARIEHR